MIQNTTDRPRRALPNRLVDHLPERTQKRFLADCEPVKFEFGERLYGPGDLLSYAYFPTGGLVSLVTALGDSTWLGLGIAGDEGMLGTPLILGVQVASHYAVVQGAGSALRIRAALFVRHIGRDARLREQLHRYVFVLMDQFAQTAACARYHFITARLARWLLLTRDRAHCNEFHLTHEFIAYMLGVRRVGITEAASSLQQRGLINYNRGEIVIVDGPGLEKASCGCYHSGNAAYEHALGTNRGMPARAGSR